MSFANLVLVACGALQSDAEREPLGTLDGEVLVARAGCIDCHTNASLEREPAPALQRAGERLSPSFLRAWLASPASVKPGTAMPDLVATLPEAERETAVDELVHFLASQGGPFRAKRVELDAAELERGRQLYHSVGCVPCHAPQESVVDLSAPLWDLALDTALAPHVATSFPDPATKWSLDALTEFLREPLELHPAGRMPSLALDAGEARALAAYLARSGIERIVEQPGWRFEYFEEPFTEASRDFNGAPSLRSGVATTLDVLPEHAEDYFGFQFTGLLEIVDAGQHRFALRSDDGSKLWLDGKLVIDNDGPHAPETKSADVWLARGRHEICVTYFESAGGQEFALKWKTPQGAEESIPPERVTHWKLAFAPRSAGALEVEPLKAERGRERFGKLGCVRCHELDGVAATSPSAASFAELAARADRGCLADSPAGTAPRYAFDARQRAAIRAALQASSARGGPAEPRERLAFLLADANCHACHARDGRGGPDETSSGYFKALVDADLGNEGRFPPPLDGVGAKLHGAWLEKVLAGRGVERPYLAARMPVFGEQRVRELPRIFEAVDAGAVQPREIQFDETQVELGRRLAGDKGLACIQCHSFNGTRSLGIPAVDMGHVVERIRPEWFERLLLDPKSVGMNSRMATFWVEEAGRLVSPVKDVLDGDPKRQIEALWQYVSLGRSMPLPDGLVVSKSEYEVEVGREPRMVGVFFDGASPRTMLVGFPERTHLAFDVEHSCLVAAWRGHFFSGEGTWLGRAGGLERPQGESVIEFERTPPFTFLAGVHGEWPTVLGRDAGYRVLGWKRDAGGRPIFRYALGDVVIEELDYPLLSPGPAKLRRSFELRAPRDVKDLHFMLGGPVTRSEGPVDARELSFSHDGILPGSTREVAFGGSYRARIVAAASSFYRVVVGDRLEGRLPVVFERDGAEYVARFEVEVMW